MVVKKKVTKEILDIVDVECDLCGKSCKTGPHPEDNLSYGTLKFLGCYGSTMDGLRLEFHICDNCVYEMIQKAQKQGNKLKMSNGNYISCLDEVNFEATCKIVS